MTAHLRHGDNSVVGAKLSRSSAGRLTFMGLYFILHDKIDADFMGELAAAQQIVEIFDGLEKTDS